MTHESCFVLYFFNDTATSEIYSLSLHDALPISLRDFRNDMVHGNIKEEHYIHALEEDGFSFFYSPAVDFRGRRRDRKSTRLNSSHLVISYAVFCLKKKKTT